jgi:hypothetical protein
MATSWGVDKNCNCTFLGFAQSAIERQKGCVFIRIWIVILEFSSDLSLDDNSGIFIRL